MNFQFENPLEDSSISTINEDSFEEMPMKASVAMFQMNSILGDMDGNKDKILSFCLSHKDCDIVMTPELSLCGYPPEDLIFHKSFLSSCLSCAQELIKASKQFPNTYLLIGLPVREEDKVFNEAFLIKDGQLLGRYKKHNLPNYGVFDERRYFASGKNDEPLVFEVKGTKFGVNICEDIWHTEAPRASKKAGAEVLLILNASPFEKYKRQQRIECVRKNVCSQGMDAVYVNAVGAQDEIVFDGFSFTLTQQGLGREMPGFEASYTIVQCKNGSLLEDSPLSSSLDISELYSALVLSLRSYIENNSFKGVVLGLSGGIDSALVLKIAVDAVGAERVEAVMMPSKFTSDMSRNDAAELAKRLKVKYSVIPIEPMYLAFEEALKNEFEGYRKDLTEENLQARIRAVILMAISNKKGLMLAATGNKSEMAVGYSTLYGDLAGGFAVIKDVYKTEVYEICNWLNRITSPSVFPENILTRAPSAELRENQKDEDSLPDYPTLDAVLKKYLEEKKALSEIIQEGFAEETAKKVISLVKRAEYKRRQGPIGPKMTGIAFGRDWRYPITNKFKEQL